MSTRNLRFRHVAIWRDPFLGGWECEENLVGVFWGCFFSMAMIR